MKRWLFCFIVCLIGLSLTFACAETQAGQNQNGIWYCPLCGRENDLNFCPVDGTKKPDDLSAGDSQANDAVDLTSLSPYYEGTVEIFRDGIVDIMGNYYDTGIRGYMSLADADRVNCYDVWDIGGQYKTLTATGIIREKDKGSSCKGIVRIYGDNKLLFERTEIDSMTKPYDISVDISGVVDLKIEMYGQGNAGTSGINSVLVDIMLHK